MLTFNIPPKRRGNGEISLLLKRTASHRGKIYILDSTDPKALAVLDKQAGEKCGCNRDFEPRHRRSQLGRCEVTATLVRKTEERPPFLLTLELLVIE
jgi:hypothetical protein